ncbi:hypothetical protein GOV14_00125 [Candidatus Pacearchaeota archaeon]|nr:hypothetical protein [Candidatus Pacearchaeota archaeon]
MKKVKFRKKHKQILIYTGIAILIIFFLYILIMPRIKKGDASYGQVHNISQDSIEFLYDLTYEKDGKVVHDTQIYDKFLEIINNSRKFILFDMFLFGSDDRPAFRNISDEVTNALLQKKKENPDIIIYFITDEMSVIYSIYNGSHFDLLSKNGINVIYTSKNKPYLERKTYPVQNSLKYMKSNLNHRKLIVADNDSKIVSLVTSANTHDPSSDYSNVAFYVTDKIWKDIYETEKQTAEINDPELDYFFETFNEPLSEDVKDVSIQTLNDAAMIDSLIIEIDKTTLGDSIDIANFYLFNLKVKAALIKASKRGVNISLILDKNLNLFGEKQFGYPNQPVAQDLIKESNGQISVRWYKTRKEQFHSKMVVIRTKKGVIVFLGSSNLSEKRVFGYNLETDIKIIADSSSKIIKDIDAYFARISENIDGEYTQSYEEGKDTSVFQRIRYEFESFMKSISL